MLAYNIVNWGEAPGRREAHVIVTPETREMSRRRGEARRRRIARALGEDPSPGIDQAIAVVTRKLGFERAEQLVEEAIAIHAGPGMLVRDGSRKRTIGGIFFQLAGASTRLVPNAAPSSRERSAIGARAR